MDPVRVSRLCSSAQQTDDGRGAPLGPNAVTLDALRALRAMQAGAQTNTWKWRFVFSGGSPPLPLPAAEGSGFPGDLLYTGHRDGRVRVWDASSEVPMLLATVPFDAGGQTGRLRGVTAVDVCTVSGLLAVAHDKGDVRVYQFSALRHEVSQTVLTAGGRPSFQLASQPAGYQCVAHLTAHDGDVTALALASRCPLLAAGDDRGCVSIVDLAQPAILHRLTVCPTPIAALAIGAYVLPPPPPAKRAKDVPNSPTEAAPDIRCEAATDGHPTHPGSEERILVLRCIYLLQVARALVSTCVGVLHCTTVHMSIVREAVALTKPQLLLQAGAVHGEQRGQLGNAGHRARRADGPGQKPLGDAQKHVRGTGHGRARRRWRAGGALGGAVSAGVGQQQCSRASHCSPYADHYARWKLLTLAITHAFTFISQCTETIDPSPGNFFL